MHGGELNCTLVHTFHFQPVRYLGGYGRGVCHGLSRPGFAQGLLSLNGIGHSSKIANRALPDVGTPCSNLPRLTITYPKRLCNGTLWLIMAHFGSSFFPFAECGKTRSFCLGRPLEGWPSVMYIWFPDFSGAYCFSPRKMKAQSSRSIVLPNTRLSLVFGSLISNSCLHLCPLGDNITQGSNCLLYPLG